MQASTTSRSHPVRFVVIVVAVALATIVGATVVLTASASAKDRPAISVDDTRQVQYILISHGYVGVGPADGVYGPRTRRAVTLWQRANDLLADGIVGPVTMTSLLNSVTVTASRPAVRLTPVVATGVPPVPPVSAESACDEMSRYRQAAGLPDVFDQIGRRESNCRNEDGVRTFCCYGYWQNYISSHLRSPGYRDRIVDECGVTGFDDINSDTPDDKRRQACVTFVVYDVSGLSPWSL